MEEMIDTLYGAIRKFSPYIIGGTIGAVVHRTRNRMSFKRFISSLIVSIFVALSVGIICKDYFMIEKDTIIFVLCGMSGVFSEIILDEIQEIISNISDYIKIKVGMPSRRGHHEVEDGDI